MSKRHTEVVDHGQSSTTTLVRSTIGSALHRHRVSLLVFVAAVLWFLPGIWWGLPIKNDLFEMEFWGTDELGPGGAVGAVMAVLRKGDNLSVQYPLAHYFFMAIFVWPYYAVVHFLDQRPSPEVMMLLHRIPSLLMSAGTVTAARAIARQIAGDLAGWFTAVAVATISSALFYSRTSNVDAATLFWTAITLLVALKAVREGLTTRSAVAVGLSVAVVTATKDQQSAFCFGLGLVLLTAHLLICRQSRNWSGWWRTPAIAFIVAASSYLVLSGVLLHPTWFFRHVQFIKGSDRAQLSQEARAQLGSYYSNPPTLAGYTKLASDVGSQTAAAVGLPMIALSLIGIVIAAGSNRRVLAFLISPPLFLLFGVIAPVRFVRPRFLLPVELIICLLAGVAVGSAVRFPRARNAIVLLAVGALGYSGLRAVDLTYQMVNDSRYEVANWMERNTKPNDTLGYFGGEGVPRHWSTAVMVRSDRLFDSNEPRPTEMPMFLFSIPTHETESVHERQLNERVFQGLLDGSLGYQQVVGFMTPALWPRPLLSAPQVNPPVRVFARNDVVSRLVDAPRNNLPDPRFKTGQ